MLGSLNFVNDLVSLINKVVIGSLTKFNDLSIVSPNNAWVIKFCFDHWVINKI